MKFELTTAATDAPVSVDEVKAHIVVEHSSDDALIAMYLAQSVSYCEAYTGQQFMPQVWTNYYNGFCAAELPFKPVQSVVVKYLDDSEQEQTLSADSYQVDTKSYPARIQYVGTLPDTSTAPNCVQVEVTCGYADAASVPDGIKAALFMMTGHLERNREATAPVNMSELPLSVSAFLRQYQVDFL